jgi:hypothetical protein
MLTLFMIVVISAFVGVAMSVTGTTRPHHGSEPRLRGRPGGRGGRGRVRLRPVVWHHQQHGRPVTTTNMMAVITPPAFPGFTYAPASVDGQLRVDAVDQYGAPTTTLTPVSVSLTNYPGWTGLSYTYLARAKMMPTPSDYNFGAGVKRQFQYIVVPLFQSMFFFQDNIEIYKAATMTINGLVHTNAKRIHERPVRRSAHVREQCLLRHQLYLHPDPPYADTWSGWSANAEVAPVYTTSQASQLHQVTAMQPLGTDLASAINTTDGNPNTTASTKSSSRRTRTTPIPRPSPRAATTIKPGS